VNIQRRDFITLFGSAAAAWPIAARAQQRERMRRIGVLMNLAADDPESVVRLAAFHQALQELGWTIGRNIQIDYRWSPGEQGRFQTYAAELIALVPDVILAAGAAIEAVKQATRSVPIVFVQAVDPVSRGIVASLARPGGNVTGFTGIEYGASAKSLELLKQIAPQVTRTAVILDLGQVAGGGQLGALQAVASLLHVELTVIDARDAGEIKRGIMTFAGRPNGGLIVVVGAFAAAHRDLIITLAAQDRLPAVYPYRYYATSGGLASYGPDNIDQYRRAAGYVDRILKGEKPADLPVQAPTKYELVINLKTAKALGLTVPPTMLTLADEVLE
jgi:putative ABC transport system substrate-binding protein